MHLLIGKWGRKVVAQNRESCVEEEKMVKSHIHTVAGICIFDYLSFYLENNLY